MLERSRGVSILLVALALAGVVSACGVVATSADLAVDGPAWAGEAVAASSGTLDLPGFNDHIDDLEPAWASSPRDLAAAALHLDRRDEAHGRVEVRVRKRFTTEPVVRVTVSDLPDDSTAAVRYELVVRLGDDDLFRFVEGTVAQRCRPGRGGGRGYGVRPCA